MSKQASLLTPGDIAEIRAQAGPSDEAFAAGLERLLVERIARGTPAIQQDIWVLTESFNLYEQQGSYFRGAWPTRPTWEQLMEVGVPAPGLDPDKVYSDILHDRQDDTHSSYALTNVMEVMRQNALEATRQQAARQRSLKKHKTNSRGKQRPADVQDSLGPGT